MPLSSPPPAAETLLPSQGKAFRWKMTLAAVFVLLLALAGTLFIGSGQSVHPAKEELGTPGTLRIIIPKYPADSVIVARYVVTENPYGADPTGVADATKAFQAALNDAATAGGGTVFVPEGTYRFDGSLVIPSTVTLRGDWKAPTDNDRRVGGSILAIYTKGAAFVSLQGAAGIDSLTLWYPEQDLSAPHAYPPTVNLDSAQAGWRNLSIKNSTFVNSWEILDTAPAQGKGKGFVVYNIYGTPLATGLILTDSSSICKAEEIHFAPEYWSDSGLANAPPRSDLAAYLQTHATGLSYQDNWVSYNISVKDYGTGITFDGKNREDIVTGERIVGLDITGAHQGIVITGDNFYINGGYISATAGKDPVAISIAPDSVNAVLLDEVTLASGGVAIDNQSTTYDVYVSQGIFTSWSGHAIASAGGHVLVEGSTFVAQPSGDKDVALGAAVEGAVFLSNTYPGSGALAVDGAAPASVVSVHDAPLILPALGVAGFEPARVSSTTLRAMIPDQPLPARAGPDSLYDVAAYGAAADCGASDFDTTGSFAGTCTDNTVAFQKALDAAGAAGGGTVYVPGSPAKVSKSYYFGGHLHVPQGVELVGAPQDSGFHTIDTRTAFLVKGDAAPFITLAAHAGVRGLTFWYTNQNGYAFMPFGYTIQAQGQGDWVSNTIIANATNALDFGSYDTTGHYIRDLNAASLNSGIYVSKSAHGFVGDVTAGGTYWLNIDKNDANQSFLSYAKSLGNPPGDTNPKDGVPDTSVGQGADLYKSGTGITLGSAKDELILNAYIHGSHTGLKTIDDSGGPSFTLIQYGSESATGLDLEALDPAGAKVISTQYHTIATNCYPGNCGQLKGAPYLIVGSGVPATTPIRFFTYANHASTPIGFDLSGGRTIIEQYYSDQDGNSAASVQTAAAIHGNATGFAMLGGFFLNPLAPGTLITNDGSLNVAIAAVMLQGALEVRGPVDLTYESIVQPTLPPEQSKRKERNEKNK